VDTLPLPRPLPALRGGVAGGRGEVGDPRFCGDCVLCAHGGERVERRSAIRHDCGATGEYLFQPLPERLVREVFFEPSPGVLAEAPTLRVVFEELGDRGSERGLIVRIHDAPRLAVQNDLGRRAAGIRDGGLPEPRRLEIDDPEAFAAARHDKESAVRVRPRQLALADPAAKFHPLADRALLRQAFQARPVVALPDDHVSDVGNSTGDQWQRPDDAIHALVALGGGKAADR